MGKLRSGAVVHALKKPVVLQLDSRVPSTHSHVFVRSHGAVQSFRDDDSQPSTQQPRTSPPGSLH